MVEAMRAWFVPRPAPSLWNEIVATVPADAQAWADAAKALFYFKTRGMDPKTVAMLRAVARRNADAYGGKPVLRLDLEAWAAGGPMFVCEKEEREDGLSEEELSAMLRAGAFAPFTGPRRPPSAVVGG